MRTSTNDNSSTGLHVYERGGLTATAGPGATHFACFAYCEHCDVEVPVDSGALCTYCFHDVPEDENE